MARTRMLKPSAFKDEDLAEISFAGRLLFFGLWTLADKEGRLEDRPKTIKAEIFPHNDVDVVALLDELSKPKTSVPGTFLIRYRVNGRKFIQITNFKKHQNPHPKEAASEIPGPSKDEPCNYTDGSGNSGAFRADTESSTTSNPEPPMPIPPGVRGDDEIDELNAIWAELRGGPHRYIVDCLPAVRSHGIDAIRVALRGYLDSKRDEKFKGTPGDFAANVLMYLPRKTAGPRHRTLAEIKAEVLREAGLP